MSALVLIVEDEPAQVEVLRYNLEKNGYRTSVAHVGEEALMLAEEEEPDLVILDWMLPDISGIEICRRLKS
ncbi:MAG: response regulator, partial [Pseudomonadota bacterium]|nr:response regulator [Pseudomonadota bacterium]